MKTSISFWGNKKKISIWIVYFTEMIVLLFNDYFIGFDYYDGTHILSRFNSTAIMNNYSRGFCMRGFVGTLLYILPFDIGWKKLAVITIVAMLCMFALLAYLGVKLIDRYSYDRKLIIGFAIMLMSPIYRIYNAYYVFGGPELYMCIVTIIAVLVLIHNDEKKLWLVPGLSLVGTLIHQGYIFEYGAVSSFCLLYLALADYRKYKYLVTNSVVLGGMFIWQQFIWKKQTIEDITYIEQYITLHLGWCDRGLLDTINGVGSKLKTGTLSSMHYIYATSFSLPLLTILYLPIIAIILIFVRSMWKSSVHKKGKLLAVLVVMAPIIAIMPDLILQTDTARFFNIVFVSIVFIQIFLMYQKSTNAIFTLNGCIDIITRNGVLLGIAIIWICSIGCLQWKYGTLYIQKIVEGLLTFIGY